MAQKNETEVSVSAADGVVLVVVDEMKRERMTRWLNNDLTEDEEWEMEDSIHDPEWRAALNEVLSPFTKLHVWHRTRSESLSVALDEHELEQAQNFGGLFLNMPMPHRGPDVSLKATPSTKGVLVYVDDPQEKTRCCLIPWGTKEFYWGDGVLNLTFTVTEEREPVNWKCQRAASELCSLAFGQGHSRALEHALNVIDQIKGFWLDRLASAAHAFEHGTLEDTDELELDVGSLLRLRIHMDILAERMCDGFLDMELIDMDKLLAPHKDGIFIIPSRPYELIMEEGPVSTGSWWGCRKRLDEQFPKWMLYQALDEARTKKPRP